MTLLTKSFYAACLLYALYLALFAYGALVMGERSPDVWLRLLVCVLLALASGKRLSKRFAL